MDNEPTSLLFDLFVANQRVRTMLAQGMAGAPLRADQYAVYSALFEFGPLSPTDLARRLGMPLTTLLEFTRPMEEAGHGRRRPHPRDQRSYQLELSASGRRAHGQTSRVFTKISDALAARLPMPEAEARRLLQALAVAAAETSG